MRVLSLFRSIDEQHLEQFRELRVHWDEEASMYIVDVRFGLRPPTSWLINLALSLISESGHEAKDGHLSWSGLDADGATASLMGVDRFPDHARIQEAVVSVPGTKHARRMPNLARSDCPS